MSSATSSTRSSICRRNDNVREHIATAEAGGPDHFARRRVKVFDTEISYIEALRDFVLGVVT